MKFQFSWQFTVFGSVAIIAVTFLAYKGIVPKETIGGVIAGWLMPSPGKLLFGDKS